MARGSSIAAAVLANSRGASGNAAAAAQAGALSPLVSSYNQQFDINRPYGTSLARPPAVFTQGAFGPMSPISPVAIDSPREDSGRPDPRATQYPVGWNLPSGVPGSEGLKLATFATLRAITDTFSVVRSCVDKRIEEIIGLKWDIIPTEEAEHAMQDDEDMRTEWEKRKAIVHEFFEHPDSDRAKYRTFSSWLSAMLEDRFVCDAVAIRFVPPRIKGKGPFGSDLASIDLIDGTTIRPMLSLSGATPRPPSVAWQQYIWGVPRVDMMSVITEADIADMGDQLVDEFRADQMLYLRQKPRNWTPYGQSPVEKALLPISIGLARQQYQWDYYKDGSIPGQFVVPGPDISTPTQIRQLQDALNAMAGDIGAKHRIIVLPPGSKAEAQKHAPLADQFDEWTTALVAMPFGLTPMDLGITPRVSAVQSVSESRQLSQINTDKGSQHRIEPTCEQLKAELFDYVIQDVFKQRDMEWSWGLTDRGEDRKKRIQEHIELTGVALESVDEARIDLGMTPWGLPETSMPMMRTATGAVPLQGLASAQPAVEGRPAAPAGGNPADEELSTPAHEGAEDLPATPTKTDPKSGAAKPAPPKAKDPKPAQKAVKTDLEILARHLRKGRRLEEYFSDVLPPEAIAAAGDALPKGVSAAVAAATSITKAFERQGRRDEQLAGVHRDVAAGLGRVVGDFQDGEVSHLQAIDGGVDVMAAGYSDAMAAGSTAAVDDIPAVERTVDFTDEAQARAEGQRGYLMGLLSAVIAGSSLGDIASRLNQYGATLTGAYEAAYGQTVQATGKRYEIIWHLGVAEHCKNCIDRDGKVFTFDDLPGWPGDGDFGGLMCLGGPNCHCSLEYREAGRTLATGENTQRPASVSYYRSQLESITAARQQAQQAREDFLSGIPEDAAARAHTRDSLRREMAARANEQIRQAGGYPGVTVEPQDIPAAQVAAATPPHMKAAAAELSKQDLAAKVYAYLAEVYPADTLDWVKQADWRETRASLADIDMDRRPGGRDPKKVRAIAQALEEGKPVDPVVLVETSDERWQIADGYHRTLAYRHAGRKWIPAYIASGVGEHGPWEREMHEKKINKAAAALMANLAHSSTVDG